MPSLFKSKPSARKAKDSIIHKFVFVEVPIEKVSSELALWGESSWWPRDCLWKFHRVTDGEIRIGTKYVIKINKPSALDWAAEITQLNPGVMIERTFTKGMFKGHEIVTLEERANGTRIDYEFHVQIQGVLNVLLWPIVLRQQYVKTMEQILKALKDFVLLENEKNT